MQPQTLSYNKCVEWVLARYLIHAGIHMLYIWYSVHCKNNSSNMVACYSEHIWPKKKKEIKKDLALRLHKVNKNQNVDV